MTKEKLKDENRRSFIKTLLLGTGATIAAGSLLSLGSKGNFGLSSQNNVDSGDQVQEIPDDPDKHWGFLIDLSKCDGCESQSDIGYNMDGSQPQGFDENNERDAKILEVLQTEKQRCSFACRINHHFLKANPPQYWINVYRLKDNPLSPTYFFPKPCQNCEDPPCEHVCPTGATYKRKDGTVLINHKICIGCRICMAACPYETRFFWFNDPDPDENAMSDSANYKPEYPVPHTRGTVVKCDYCIHNVYFGNLPHCVSACPQGALYFGNLNEDAVSNGHEVLELKKTLKEKGGTRFKEEEGTSPSVYYIPHSKTNGGLW